MAKSMIYIANTGVQTVPAGGNVLFGSVVRRFGPNLSLSGNGVEARGSGYYSFSANLAVAPVAAGEITATLLKDGVAIPGAVATATVASAGDFVTLPLIGVIREGCCMDSASTITCVLDAEASVANVAFKGTKE